MGRWTADSDYDYQEETGNGPVRWPLCATPECGNKAAAFSYLCSECNVIQQTRKCPASGRAGTENRMTKIVRWAAEWHSRNRRDGDTRHVLFQEPNRPALFSTRTEARQWIAQHFGYIKGRRDLRDEPHGWRLPRAIRVVVTIRPTTERKGQPA